MSQEQVATQQIRSSDWAQIIQNRNSSGLTISEYCSQMGISETAYYYWLRKLRRAALSSGGIELVEIKVIRCLPPLKLDLCRSAIHFKSRTLQHDVTCYHINDTVCIFHLQELLCNT